MAVSKIHNSLAIDCPIEGLPVDWRERVQATVLHVGKIYDLYVTTAKAGATRSPPGILVSISREGSEEAWTPKVEATLKLRILQQLDMARDEEAERLGAIAALEAEVAGGARRTRRKRIPAVDREQDAASRRSVEARRAAVAAEVKAALARARLSPQAEDLGKLALSRMKQPDRWSMWARLLLAVDETAEAIGEELERRMESLA
jgi:hypothetical protein